MSLVKPRGEQAGRRRCAVWPTICAARGQVSATQLRLILAHAPFTAAPDAIGAKRTFRGRRERADLSKMTPLPTSERQFCCDAQRCPLVGFVLNGQFE